MEIHTVSSIGHFSLVSSYKFYLFSFLYSSTLYIYIFNECIQMISILSPYPYPPSIRRFTPILTFLLPSPSLRSSRTNLLQTRVYGRESGARCCINVRLIARTSRSTTAFSSPLLSSLRVSCVGRRLVYKWWPWSALLKY